MDTYSRFATVIVPFSQSCGRTAVVLVVLALHVLDDVRRRAFQNLDDILDAIIAQVLHVVVLWSRLVCEVYCFDDRTASNHEHLPRGALITHDDYASAAFGMKTTTEETTGIGLLHSSLL